MNLLDLLLLAALLLAAARGFRQGALSQVAAFGGAAFGLVVGAVVAPDLATVFVTGPGPRLALATLVLLLGIVLVGQALGLAIGLRLRAAAADVGADTVDRTAGVAVGAAGLLLTVWVLAAALGQGPSPAVASQIRDSRVVSAIGEALPPPPDLFSRVGTYLDQQGFPQVFTGIGGGAIAPPVDLPQQGAVAAAGEAGQVGTVQVEATGCGSISFGSGFVPDAGYVVTNAHVVAGGDVVAVRDAAGTHEAVAVHFDPDVDLAVLHVPDLGATALSWASSQVGRGVGGATLGFPGGKRELAVKPSAVRGRGQAVGRDVYGRGTVTREILTLSADVRRGDSGGPFVTSDGEVGGVVFAAAASEPGTGYALTAESVRPTVADVVGRTDPVDTGDCRF